MSDEGFHEIQLNGKQLVFLFMAGTVVAVVIFLCGVMVGRGVPTGTGSASDAPEQAGLDPTAALQESPAAQTVAGSGNAPVTAQETLTYPSLLEDRNPPAETLRPPVEPAAGVPAPAAVRPAPVPGGPPPSREASADRSQASGQRRINASAAAAKPAVAAKPAAVAPKPATVAPKPAVAPAPAVAPTPAAAPKPVAAAPKTPPADVALAEPPGNGFVVQVAAVRQRTEANTIAHRLSTRGYPAFVTTAGPNFRVRVGKYTDRREAESVAGRLEKEEQFKPWITR